MQVVRVGALIFNDDSRRTLLRRAKKMVLHLINELYQIENAAR